MFGQALAELRAGRKRSHWMWFIFPQIEGLGFSATSRHFALTGIEEARAYLDHPLLGPRLLACAEALLGLAGRSASEIFGHPDDMKLRSSATLFDLVSPAGSVFERLLAIYFDGAKDARTLDIVAGKAAAPRRQAQGSL